MVWHGGVRLFVWWLRGGPPSQDPPPFPSPHPPRPPPPHQAATLTITIAAAVLPGSPGDAEFEVAYE